MTYTHSNKVIHLPDPRTEQFHTDLLKMIMDKYPGMTVAQTIGVMEIVKHELIERL